MRSRLWLIRVLLVIGILLSFLHLGSVPEARTTPDEIFCSVRELVRIPLSGIKPGSVVRFNTSIQPSKIDGIGPGTRFFQASLVQKEGNTPWMLPWPKGGITVKVSQDGKDLPLREVQGEFYLVSSDTGGAITGMAFDPVTGKDCALTLTFNTSDFPKDTELVVAPNWPNPMSIKDQIVGAMVGPALDSPLLWMSRAGLALIFLALILTFGIPHRAA